MGATDIAILDGLSVSAHELRSPLECMSPGVLDPLDFKVVPRAAGADRSVDLSSGRAVVRGPAVSLPAFMCPKYMVAHDATVNSSAFELGGITAPNGSFSRLDQIILRVYDNEGGVRKWRPEVLTGATPTQNATLTNRHNAAPLPAGVPSLRVADVVVPTTGIITAAQIADRRPWARGAYAFKRINSGNLSRATPGRVEIAGSQLKIECQGNVPVRLRATIGWSNNTAPTSNDFSFFQDGIEMSDSIQEMTAFGGGNSMSFTHSYILIPIAGLHVYSIGYGPVTGTMTVFANPTIPILFEVEEFQGRYGTENT